VDTSPPPRKRKLSRSPIVPLAFEFQRLLASGGAKNQAELAHRFRLTRARVTQIMNILKLPAPVVDCLSGLFHDERCQYTERQLRRILALPTEEEQVRAFEQLREMTEVSTSRVEGDRGEAE